MRKKLAIAGAFVLVIILSAGVGAVVASTVISPSSDVLYEPGMISPDGPE